MKDYHMADFPKGNNTIWQIISLVADSSSPSAQISGKYPNKIIVPLSILCVHFVLIFPNINSNLSTNTYSSSF